MAYTPTSSSRRRRPTPAVVTLKDGSTRTLARVLSRRGANAKLIKGDPASRGYSVVGLILAPNTTAGIVGV